MDYDATRVALYTPEAQGPVEGFSVAWPLDPICAELSRLAYYRFEEGGSARLEAALAAAGFSPPALFNAPGEDAQAFGTTAGDAAFLVFRGTQAGKLSDLVSDVRFRLRPWEGSGRVHEGFLAAWLSLADPIGAWLEGNGERRLVVTGHSLGAAMATLAATRIPEAELVTFGSPRVGDAGFAAAFSGASARRYVDCADKVTTVPPELIGYRHLGGEHYIDRFGRVHAEPPPPAFVADDRRAARRAYWLKHAWKVWRNVLVRDLADHAPINYVSAVLGRRNAD
jgi:triacylglycerol lipase